MRRALALVCAAAALLAGCGGGGSKQTVTQRSQGQGLQTQAAQVQTTSSNGDSAATPFDAEAIYKVEAPGVVTVIAISGGRQNALGSGSEALGSGFVVDQSGYVATNAHVVTSDSGKPVDHVYVQFSDGNKLGARIVGTDPDADIALVKVNPADLRGPNAKLDPLPFGSTSAVKVGDPVAAIGSPFGEEQSLSVGVVSALGRDIQSLTNFTIGNAIQTDAAINHGNSGGPLIDGAGKVIGVNAQIQSTGGGGEGVGFAIPIETVNRSIGQLRTKGHVDYAYLGISSVSLYPQLAQREGLTQLDGALVDQVKPGGPAAKAGLRGAKSHITFQGQPDIPVGGDLITGVDDSPVKRAQDLSNVIALHQPGDKIQLHVVRDGKNLTLTVTLGKRPERQSGNS